MSQDNVVPDQVVTYCPMCGQVTDEVIMPDTEGLQIHCAKCNKWTIITHIFDSERSDKK